MLCTFCGLLALFAAPTDGVRRLAPSAFPNLPPAIVSVLKAQQCTIPQPDAKKKRNVIRGTFFSAQQQSWAVLCSSRGKSYILVFRNDDDTKPERIAEQDDSFYIGGDPGGPVWYQREITAVGREYITAHHTAYGGPKPPRIVHQAIDNSFLEKASITYYRHQGKWLQLQGAD